VNVSLDASVLVALFTNDPFTDRVDSYLRAEAPSLLISDFAGTEMASAIARRVRTTELTTEEANDVFVAFDEWPVRLDSWVETMPADIALATTFVRRLDLGLRAPDALNIAIAQRAGNALWTFDQKMAEGARTLGMTLINA
jgi:predicted nucleic acid-binding protein